MRPTPPLGCHVPAAGGLVRGALGYARRVGAEAIQVFASNPRGWAASPGDPGEDEAFRAACAGLGWPVFVHAPYLVNLGSPLPEVAQRSAAAVSRALERGGRLGARGVVVHAGSAGASASASAGGGAGADAGAERAAALRRLHDLVLALLDGADPDGPLLLVEPTASGTAALATGLEQLAEYLAALEDHPRVSVCLDTCHLFAAGHDIASRPGMWALLDRFDGLLGASRLALVHLNDSRDPLGSGRDRHQRPGLGTLGLDALAAALTHPVCAGVPMLLECPGSEQDTAADLALLRRRRGRPGTAEPRGPGGNHPI